MTPPSSPLVVVASGRPNRRRKSLKPLEVHCKMVIDRLRRWQRERFRTIASLRIKLARNIARRLPRCPGYQIIRPVCKTAMEPPSCSTKIRNSFSRLELISADSGYGAHQVRAALAKVPSLRIEIIKRSDAIKGFAVLPRRWVMTTRNGRPGVSTRAWIFRPFTFLLASYPLQSQPLFFRALQGLAVEDRGRGRRFTLHVFAQVHVQRRKKLDQRHSSRLFKRENRTERLIPEAPGLRWVRLENNHPGKKCEPPSLIV
jgi:hypothetical protein